MHLLNVNFGIFWMINVNFHFLLRGTDAFTECNYWHLSTSLVLRWKLIMCYGQISAQKFKIGRGSDDFMCKWIWKFVQWRCQVCVNMVKMMTTGLQHLKSERIDQIKVTLQLQIHARAYHVGWWELTKVNFL